MITYILQNIYRYFTVVGCCNCTGNGGLCIGITAQSYCPAYR